MCFIYSTDPPEVTSLTVNSHELGSDYVISEGEKVTVICSFNKGYPPSHFHLVDKLGQELQITRNEETISHSFSVECEDEWPIIGCEGEGSEVNRSVSFLVRCKFQTLYFVFEMSCCQCSLYCNNVCVHCIKYFHFLATKQQPRFKVYFNEGMQFQVKSRLLLERKTQLWVRIKYSVLSKHFLLILRARIQFSFKFY